MITKQRCIKIIIIVATLLCCTSCKMFKPYRSDKLNSDEITEKRIKSIIEAIENKDNEKIKSMFSIQVLEEANDIDAGIEYIMSYYKGNIISTDKATGTHTSWENGEKKTENRNNLYLLG